MLFRGVIQAAVAREIGGPHGIWVGLLIAAMLFGLLHSITPTYAFLAGLIGLYLGGLWVACDNLLVPITVHALYDFVVLVYLVKMREVGQRARPTRTKLTPTLAIIPTRRIGKTLLNS